MDDDIDFNDGYRIFTNTYKHIPEYKLDFDDDEWGILLSYFKEGMTYEEIAQKQSISKTEISRSIKKFYRKFNKSDIREIKKHREERQRPGPLCPREKERSSLECLPCNPPPLDSG